MSKTISFVASDELAEFLEEESERRMTTISSTAQMLLAEHVRAMKDDRDLDESSTSSDTESMSEEDEEDEEEHEILKPPKDPYGGQEELFRAHEDRWYVPDGEKSAFAVHLKGSDGVRYYKTAEGAAERLRNDYGDIDGGDEDV